MHRFERQINLQGFGTEGQYKLSRSSALVIGAGGLGCPALIYLAAAGVGKIGIADGDTISISNLNRQVLYGEKDEGKKKAAVAGSVLREKYSDIEIEIFPDYLNTENSLGLLSKYDVILDCTDNFSARYMISDACVLLNKPLVYGGIFAYEGQVSFFNLSNERGERFNYRDLFAVPPESSQIPNCDETGVLGVLPGIIGTLQATEAIKYLSETGTVLSGKILFYNLLRPQFYEMELTQNPDIFQYMPLTPTAFRNFDYSLTCSSVRTIDWNQAYALFRENPEETIFIDVREWNELPRAENLPLLHLPLSLFPEEVYKAVEKQNLLIFCQAGVRSVKAAKTLKKIFPGKNIYSIKGGITDPNSPVRALSVETPV